MRMKVRAALCIAEFHAGIVSTLKKIGRNAWKFLNFFSRLVVCKCLLRLDSARLQGVDRSGVGGGMPTSSVRGGGQVSLPARSRGFDLQVSSFAFVVVVSPFPSSAVQTLMGQVSVSLLLSVGQRGADAARARPGARDRPPSTSRVPL